MKRNAASGLFTRSSMMTSRPGEGGAAACFDKPTMNDHQLKACVEPAEGPTKIALVFETG